MFHLNVHYRSRDGGRACDAARQYVAREGRYKKRGDTVRWVRSLHMPKWVKGASAATYWRAAEGRHSRANARTALLVEFAIPKQLSKEDQDALVIDMLESLSAMGDEQPGSLRLPVTVAVHEGYGRNPHAHALVSLSLNDGVCRSKQTWFRRYSRKHPTQGGARRSEYVTKRRWIFRVRALWATLANAALVRRGMQPALDHRSHAARGLPIAPQIHLGPRIADMSRRGFDTARGRRKMAIDEANEAALEAQAKLRRKRQALIEAELELEASIDAERLWRDRQQAEWDELLRNHPLTRSFVELRQHATALVVESERANANQVKRALDTYANVRPFAELLGPDWSAIPTADGFWGIKPGREQVVLLARGYVATDGEDEDSLRAMLAAVPMLGMMNPVVAVDERARASVQRILGELGHAWRLIAMNLPERHSKSGPRL
jgi:hypothetical protein